MQWYRTFGSGDEVYGASVQQTTDGGYIICGRIYSIETHMEGGVWLIKTDTEGNKLWDRTFGGELYAYGHSVQQTTDGGYIICGKGDTEKTIGRLGALLIKTDADGNKLWDRIFNINGTHGWSAQQTPDGGYIVCGTAHGDEAWLIKTDANGNKLWDKAFGKEIKGSSGCQSIQRTADGGYIVCGWAYFDESNHVLLFKLAPEQ